MNRQISLATNIVCIIHASCINISIISNDVCAVKLERSVVGKWQAEDNIRDLCALPGAC